MCTASTAGGRRYDDGSGRSTQLQFLAADHLPDAAPRRGRDDGRGARACPQETCAYRGNAVVDLISSMDSREVMLKILTCEMSAW